MLVKTKLCFKNKGRIVTERKTEKRVNDTEEQEGDNRRRCGSTGTKKQSGECVLWCMDGEKSSDSIIELGNHVELDGGNILDKSIDTGEDGKLMFSNLVFLCLFMGFIVREVIQLWMGFFISEVIELSVIDIEVEEELTSRKGQNEVFPVEAWYIGYHSKFLNNWLALTENLEKFCRRKELIETYTKEIHCWTDDRLANVVGGMAKKMEAT